MSKTILFYLILVVSHSNEHSVEKRALLFPRATFLQFTYGLTVPAVLPSRSINLSLCFQVNYDLPYNLSHLLAPRIVQAKAHNQFDLSRETFYKYIISFLDGFGLNGEACLCRLICELAESPLHLEQKENLLERLAHFIFTPSVEKSSNHSVFHQAEKYGKDIGECPRQYSNCLLSLVDLFTAKFLISQ